MPVPPRAAAPRARPWRARAGPTRLVGRGGGRAAGSSEARPRGSCGARSTSGGIRWKARRSTRLTDFEGAEHHAAISRDGKFVAFLSDHDGAWDAWVSQVGTGDVHNLTKGSVPELRNPGTRTVGFSPDGSLVTLWSRVSDPAGGGLVDAGWAVPTMGGPLRPYLKGISELDWSPDGRRIVYHPPTPGDPLFVTEPDEKVGRVRSTSRGQASTTTFPSGRPTARSSTSSRAFRSMRVDVWRIRPTGGEPERLTFHDSRVTFPTLLDDRTLLYLATDADGYGPWIYAMDVERRVPHRISTGVEEYTSLAASANGRRLVATVSRSTAGLWRVPIADRVIDKSGATPISLPTATRPVAARGARVHRLSCPESRNRWPLEARRRHADAAVERRSTGAPSADPPLRPTVNASPSWCKGGDGRNCT